MRFRKTLTLLMLAMGLVFALSAWTQQKPFTRDQVQGLVQHGSERSRACSTSITST